MCLSVSGGMNYNGTLSKPIFICTGVFICTALAEQPNALVMLCCLGDIRSICVVAGSCCLLFEQGIWGGSDS